MIGLWLWLYLKVAGAQCAKGGGILVDWVSGHFSVKLLCSLFMKAKVFMKA